MLTRPSILIALGVAVVAVVAVVTVVTALSSRTTHSQNRPGNSSDGLAGGGNSETSEPPCPSSPNEGGLGQNGVFSGVAFETNGTPLEGITDKVRCLQYEQDHAQCHPDNGRFTCTQKIMGNNDPANKQMAVDGFLGTRCLVDFNRYLASTLNPGDTFSMSIVGRVDRGAQSAIGQSKYNLDVASANAFIDSLDKECS
jgi:hypothetical protein